MNSLIMSVVVDTRSKSITQVSLTCTMFDRITALSERFDNEILKNSLISNLPIAIFMRKCIDILRKLAKEEFNYELLQQDYVWLKAYCQYQILDVFALTRSESFIDWLDSGDLIQSYIMIGIKSDLNE